MRGGLARRLSYVAMAVVAAVALMIGVLDEGAARTVDDRVLAVASTVRCPQCASQSAADSDTSAAQAVRREIAERIDAGQSDDEIRDYFASTFGDEILLNPPASGAGALVWVIPVVALVVGGAGLALAFRRWKAWG